MTPIRRGLIVSALLLLFAGSVAALGLRFSDGPVFVFPGGPFRSGELIDYRDVVWGAHAATREIEFQLGSPPARAPYIIKQLYV